MRYESAAALLLYPRLTWSQIADGGAQAPRIPCRMVRTPASSFGVTKSHRCHDDIMVIRHERGIELKSQSSWGAA